MYINTYNQDVNMHFLVQNEDSAAGLTADDRHIEGMESATI